MCVTAQQCKMLDQVLDLFKIISDYGLNLMKADQILNDVTARILIEPKPILKEFKPGVVLVYGEVVNRCVNFYMLKI
jgi:UDP-N-acetylglucosamine 2-epimerase (non-hydrolysing)